MRKLFVASLLAGLIVGSVVAPSDAKKKRRERNAEATYTSPAVGSASATGTCPGDNGCARFPVGSKERYLQLEIADDSGMPVSATIGQDTDPSNATVEVVGRICGETEEPLAIEPGVEVVVWVWVLPSASPPCPGMATAGTVKAIFSNVP